MPQLREVPRADVDPGVLTQGFDKSDDAAVKKAVVRLFSHWELSDAQASTLLGGIGERTYQRWKAGEYGRKAQTDLLTRIGLLVGIHKALGLLFVDKANRYAWIKTENTAFQEKTPLTVMLQGQIDDIATVRRYLDAARGVW